MNFYWATKYCTVQMHWAGQVKHWCTCMATQESWHEALHAGQELLSQSESSSTVHSQNCINVLSLVSAGKSGKLRSKATFTQLKSRSRRQTILFTSIHLYTFMATKQTVTLGQKVFYACIFTADLAIISVALRKAHTETNKGFWQKAIHAISLPAEFRCRNLQRSNWGCTK